MKSSAQRRDPAERVSERGAESVADRRSKLLEAGLVLFAERGFDGVSIRDIAGQAGVNVGLLYHYFDDKRSLYDAVLTDAIEVEVSPQLAVLNGPGDARTKLNTFVLNLLDSILAENPRRKLIERMFIDTADGISPAIEPMRSRFLPPMQAILDELNPGGGEIPWPVISGIFNGFPHAVLRSHRAYEPGRRSLGPDERDRLAALLTKIIVAAFAIAAEEAGEQAK